MSVLWTPVEGSGQLIGFDFYNRSVADKKRLLAPAAGTHVKVLVRGCYPVYFSIAEPATEAAMYQGTAIQPGVEWVLPRSAAMWFSSPDGNNSFHASVGTMT